MVMRRSDRSYSASNTPPIFDSAEEISALLRQAPFVARVPIDAAGVHCASSRSMLSQ